MKITMNELRKMIQEEKAKLGPADVSWALGQLHDAIDKLVTIFGTEQTILELEGIIETMSTDVKH